MRSTDDRPRLGDFFFEGFKPPGTNTPEEPQATTQPPKVWTESARINLGNANFDEPTVHAWRLHPPVGPMIYAYIRAENVAADLVDDVNRGHRTFDVLLLVELDDNCHTSYELVYARPVI